MIASGVAFIAPASKHYVGAETLAGQKISAATRVDYVAARDEGKPVERRGVWHVRDDVMTLAGPRKNDPVLRLRRIFVHSSARAQAAEAARAKKLARAGEDLARLERGLGSRHYPDEQAVTDRITAIGRARRVSAYLTAVTGTDPGTGKPTLAWRFDQQVLDAEAATDGWYALLTNLDADQGDAGQVLRHYKGQEAVEHRYQAFKGPLAVTSLYLKDNRRITALITVICLALLIFCLIERQVRHALAARGATKVDGLVRRTARHSHRQAHPRRAGRHPANPGHWPVTPDHPAAHRSPTRSPRPPRHRSMRPPLKTTHVRKTGLAGWPDLAMAYGRRAAQLVQQVREQRAALLQPPLPAAFCQP
ncbi:hypothetical protein HD596_006128 [Nonomuraea jabiensis]|uniref:Transposase IS4-like domain-containing protein n=1 Tax=Nonomuraea jabiensis TaxID=882448 RepID=A0A7W9G8W9_9ACTN|nr:hypothetical protein [Nonomuraea jabiensis]